MERAARKETESEKERETRKMPRNSLKASGNED